MKFLTKEGNGPQVIRERMLAVHGNAASSLWYKQLKWSRESIEYVPHLEGQWK
jgi:hypothetical protein